VQPGSLLVVQEQGDRRVLELLELPGTGRRDREAGPAQRAKHVGGRVRIEAFVVQGVAQPPSEVLEKHGACAERRPRPQELTEHSVVDVGPPRQTGMLHLGSGEGTGALGSEKQAQASRVRGGAHRVLLAAELRDHPRRIRSVVDKVRHPLPEVEVEERRPVRLTFARGLRRRTLIPRVRRRRREFASRGESGAPEDRVREAEINAPLDADPGIEEFRIPGARVVPHPPCRAEGRNLHCAGQIGGLDNHAGIREGPPAFRRRRRGHEGGTVRQRGDDDPVS
jgi:hypothetical protein